jgi:carbonic anhydrase/acetyltransferase-like protein (isoleucine patch superfamily)
MHELPELACCGARTVVEKGAMIMCPEAVHLGSDVTIAALALLVGDREGELRVGDRT